VIYAYLRVSTASQSVENQKYGLLEYANSRGFAPVEFVEETVSRSKDWRARKLGGIIDAAMPGDVILCSEITRLAGTTLQVLEIIKAVLDKGAYIHITKQGIIFDESLQTQIMAVCLGLASQIERHFISQRTKEALKVAREAGKQIGRPKGSKADSLKLDKKRDELEQLISFNVPKIEIAKRLGVSPKTLRRYLVTRKFLKSTTKG
jgi:putative DNA-invertase from lambdoid prophage Rac